MHSLIATVVLGALSSTVGANPFGSRTEPDQPFSTPTFAIDTFNVEAFNETSGIEARDIRGALPNRATSMEHQFQPVTDFDRDGCYYTSAIDPNGNTNPGLGAVAKCPQDDCRSLNRLQNNNVYSRMRCNNGWCAIMYEYYFEKDQAICGSFLGGHRHDWENIVVFVQNNQVKRVSPSCHGNYDKPSNSPHKQGERVKMVYHKDGAGTHCFRTANSGDDNIENHTGQWFIGSLVGWTGWPSTGLRDKVMNTWSGGIGPKLDTEFADCLRRAAGNSVPGFNPNIDG
ncbi:hypothetical protein MMYC01_201422 [Madurella mycetomatis]|uniref:Secreted protein n=1 Tax=Madurella mycetomatis TaxID=100816 RepID=A0A175WBX5_9PEZI|nr:hypothetical protein MMYC01_201422 [Madurella mycetomatis]